MSKTLIYTCLCVFLLRVLFVPLFSPFGTYGFFIQASVVALCLILSGRWLLKGEGWPKSFVALIVAALVDAAFLMLTKSAVYGEYPFYPRYIVMSIPIGLGLYVSFRQK